MKDMKDMKKIFIFIDILLFITIYAFRSFTDAIYVSKGIDSNFLINVKYFLLIFAIFFLIFQIKFSKKAKIFQKEFFNIVIAIISLIFISLFMFLINNFIYGSFYEMIFKLLIPIVYVYLLLNVLDFKSIYICMAFALVLSFGGYIIEVGVENFNINNLLSIDFINSYSPFESDFSSGTAIAMCAFFMYYRKNKFFTILSLVFALLTFKRFAVIFAFALLFLPKLVNINKALNKKWITIAKITFIILTPIYLWLLLPNQSNLFFNIFNDTQRQFTMGRSDFLNQLLSNNFHSSGYGSITNILGRSIEMDLISIYLETTLIGLVIFVNCYWNCSGGKLYTFIYMLFQFINLLTSHSLENSFNWILILLTIGVIAYKKEEVFHPIFSKFKLKKEVSING